MMKAFAPLFAAVAIATVGALPTSAMAQRHSDRYGSRDRYDSRKASKDQWKGVAVAGGVVGLIGAATHNPTLAAVGAAGAVYGAVRYDNERKNDRYGYRRGDDRRRDDDRYDRDDHYGYGYGYGRNDEYRRRDDRRDDRRDGRGYGSYRDSAYGTSGYRDAVRRRDEDRRRDDRRYDDRVYSASRRDDDRRDDDRRDGRSHG